MANHVSLEDCTLNVSQIPSNRLWSDSKFRLGLSLPGMMDLTRIPYFQRWTVDHEQHIGSSGILYIACDDLARFWSWEYMHDNSEDRQCINFDLRTLGGTMSNRKFQNFKLDGLDWLLKGLNQKDKADIIAGINSYESLAIYLKRFFEWVNDFIEIYGEGRFYNPLDGVDRFTREYYNGLPSHPMHQRVISVPANYLSQNINF